MGRIEVKRHDDTGICTIKTEKKEFSVVYRGAIELLNREIKVAIVGSRKASEKGVECARLLAKEFGSQGVVVVSGYALGIDTAAHQGALEEGDGATIIVLAEGINRFNPQKLKDIPNWRERTLVLSQFGPDAKWSSTNAMMRNEIICQLADAVIVVEAGPEKDESGKMSGSFQAGKTALRLGVPLFVIVPETHQLSSESDPIWKCPKGNKQLLDSEAMELRIDPTNLVESVRNAVKKVLEVIRHCKGDLRAQESPRQTKKQESEQPRLNGL